MKKDTRGALPLCESNIASDLIEGVLDLVCGSLLFV